jgi:pSer/pThr/pTyr-binding forkhead associated (FHA) protein
MAYILVQFASGRVQRVEITKNPMVLGRGRSCGFQVVDPKASRRHCQIKLEQGQWFLEDLNSKNHTWIGTENVVRLPLNDGDQFRIGSTFLTFRVEENATQSFSSEPKWS